MKLGLSTYSFPWAFGVDGFFPEKPFTILNLLEFAAGYGIENVQLCDNSPFGIMKENEFLEVKRSADEFGIKLEVGARRLTKQDLLHHLSIAEKLGSPFLRMVIDDGGYHPNEREVIGIIGSVIENFRAAGICLAIENHDRFPVTALERIILQTDPEIIGVCLDTANSLGAGEGIKEVVSVLGRYTVNLHIKDFRIRRVANKMGFTVEGAAAGEGMLDIPWLIDEVAMYGKCNTITLEVWSNPEETIPGTLDNERQMVEKSIKYLQGTLQNADEVQAS